VTEPLTSPPTFTAPVATPTLAQVDFPLDWLVSVAPPPLQFRAIVEVARLGLPRVDGFDMLPFSYAPALRLAVMQSRDGSWNSALLSVPEGSGDPFDGVGTVPAVMRLLEYGWGVDAPPLWQAKRLLFRLLAEDEDPAFAFELAPKGKPNVLKARHARGVIREAAAATLARAGYENDPRLRGAATRLLDRVDAFVRSPLAEKPFMRVGNQHVLAPEAHPPSFHLMVMLAHMPIFRNERFDAVERLQQYLTQAVPRPTPAVVLGNDIVEMPQLLLGDPLPHRTAADADLPWSLVWLELAARLGFLRTNENWLRLYERLLDDRNSEGIWRDPKRSVKMVSSSPHTWSWFPLIENGGDVDQAAEVTFRLGMIGRFSGRQIVVR
jgi:hypothetical protein